MNGSAPLDPSDLSSPAADLPAALFETHISVVFLVGDHAYKLKKPVRFPFADLTTRAARLELCRREVALNQRLAPDVYLGVADIDGPDGEPCDHLVVMRRMPADRRLTTLVLADDPDVPTALDDLASQLATFHAHADRSPVIDQAGTPDAVAALWHENFDELGPFTDAMLDAGSLGRARALADAFLAGREALFARRIDERQICDGHGDLQADDVFCLPDGPRALDCIEFFDGFRFGDVANDVAFLAMDLERLGAPVLAARFVAAYEAAAGRALPPQLVSFFIAYRAQVRTKVTCLRAAQQEPGSPAWTANVDAARGLLALCLRHLEATTVRLVLVGGLPGAGKSTVAASLAETLGAHVVRSDVVRKELAGIAPTDHVDVAFQTDLYTPEMTDRVHATMLDEARSRLEQGTSVVLDASFARARHRAAARRLAADTTARVHELCCVLDATDAAARLKQRRTRPDDVSDATPAIAAAMTAAFDPWPSASPLDTSGPTDASMRVAHAAVINPD